MTKVSNGCTPDEAKSAAAAILKLEAMYTKRYSL
jgi:hypothetical protein